MTYLKFALASASTLVTLVPGTLAGWDAAASDNIAVYWGQNSANSATSQQRLSYYCANTEIDVIPIAFMTGISTPATNFASAGNECTTFSGTGLLDCPQIEADIIQCQQTYGKTIMLSLGGATYTEGGFSSSSAAETAATNVWNLFGTPTGSANRPFGTAVVDGFDFDLETSTQNMAPFGQKLRSLMDAATSAGAKKFYLSAAPQCPYPDVADNDMLDGAVYFDWIQVQFYNNYCGVSAFTAGSTTQNNFNFATWDTWAKETSLNPNVKVLLGVPASSGAGGGYVSASTLGPIIDYCKGFSSFGGVMMWDMSQLYGNSGFLDTVYDELINGVATTTVKPTTTATTFTTSTTAPASTGVVGAYNQCGGTGYTGPAQCIAGYVCTEISSAWSQCDPA
ncbi:putative chitinase [Seiridium cardinale]|uniref:chitinase n=1 Tax=Seiridium cardinale TaxID=138064 RepID=A0ABR2XUG9_9PEZI